MRPTWDRSSSTMRPTWVHETYLGQKLPNETIPFASLFIFRPIGSVVNPLDAVVEL
jgi:hypothetical protein